MSGRKIKNHASDDWCLRLRNEAGPAARLVAIIERSKDPVWKVGLLSHHHVDLRQASYEAFEEYWNARRDIALLKFVEFRRDDLKIILIFPPKARDTYHISRHGSRRVHPRLF